MLTGPAVFKQLKEFFVTDHSVVDRRDVNIVFGHRNANPAQPRNVALSRCRRRHHPETVLPLTKFGLLDQSSQIFKSGELWNAGALHQVPEKHH